MAAAVAALRMAVEHQAGLLPPPAPAPRPAPVIEPLIVPEELHYRPTGIDWSQG
jgi:hypothetical protein